MIKKKSGDGNSFGLRMSSQQIKKIPTDRNSFGIQ
jgi:hypothetical protein